MTFDVLLWLFAQCDLFLYFSASFLGIDAKIGFCRKLRFKSSETMLAQEVFFVNWGVFSDFIKV